MKSFSKRSAFYALDGLVDKIGDIKVKINSGLSLHSYITVVCIVLCVAYQRYWFTQ